MKLLKTHPWQEPLAFTARFADQPEFALFYSGRQERFSGKWSFLFLEPKRHVTGTAWHELPDGDDSELPQWVGYLGYGMRAGLEHYTRGTESFISLPDFWFTSYARMFRFDHVEQIIGEFGEGAPFSIPTATSPKASHGIASLSSNLTRKEYETAVNATLERIAAGDFYQANITRKFFGEFSGAGRAWDIFETLSTVSPAPYSAFIKHGEKAILSSSPECFIAIDGKGKITARPIKGSARRGANQAEDTQLRNALAASEKNSAENLMIVDLMRNDLSRVSEPGSVAVAERSALYSYATIHHLVSTITAQRRADVSTYDVVKAAFPPGSMTGAPKIAAIEWCAKQEKLERGVYSGAIGWLGKNTCDLSVVIRTLLIDGNRFEFQVGGGIVADSEAEDEWRETLIKARGIAAALGIKEEQLAAL